jgi:hypothetical protein
MLFFLMSDRVSKEECEQLLKEVWSRECFIEVYIDNQYKIINSPLHKDKARARSLLSSNLGYTNQTHKLMISRRKVSFQAASLAHLECEDSLNRAKLRLIL